MVKGVVESLAGRCGGLSLLPFQEAECPDSRWEEMELCGSYPELVTRNYAGSSDWYDAYILSYIERDIRSLLEIEKLRDFRVVLGLLAARLGQELNLSTVAREAGVTEKTVSSWVSVLEASYLIFLLQPFHRNLGKRLVKRPKLYFWDTGLACRLTGIGTREHLEKGPLSGAMFENYAVAELAKDIAHRGLDTRLYYYRSNSGIEADFVLEDRSGRRLIFGEVKRRLSVRPEDFKHLHSLGSSAKAGGFGDWKIEAVVINSGDKIERPSSGQTILGVGIKGGLRFP
jgi:hypothetical protein